MRAVHLLYQVYGACYEEGYDLRRALSMMADCCRSQRRWNEVDSISSMAGVTCEIDFGMCC